VLLVAALRSDPGFEDLVRRIGLPHWTSEGEILNPETVRSSVARRLGVPEAAAGPQDRRVEGMVAMLIDATKNYRDPLTRERLFHWQADLFPSGRSDFREIKIGAWRDDSHGPMQVVSGTAGREHVYFEAPPANRIEAEMKASSPAFGEVLFSCVPRR
jgi:hypothetical protein